MADSSSSSGSRRYDVFPSFRGEDVRKGFLSYLLMEFDRRSINPFIDYEIERSRSISPELLWVIREARISIVIFSKNYASSNWCLDELVEIHNCYKELNQKVIPIFYDVDSSEVRKQSGEFGESFMKTCLGKSDGQKQKWKEALTDVANLAGEHLQNWSDEASMVKKIATDVLYTLLPPSNAFGDFVGIEAHIEAMESLLCLESEEPRMVGIWGLSGFGKSTLGRALFTHLSPKFPLYAFLTYKSIDQDVVGMKLCWEKQLLDEIFDKNIKVDCLGMVQQMLKHKKVLIILDDVVKPMFLETLVGKTEWFGRGSRIIVITQDRQILKGHKIDLLYEVKIPDQDLALKMLCRSAFGQESPPDDFKELAVEVAKIAGNFPLSLRVLGLSLKGRTNEDWMEMLPGLRNSLNRDIMSTLKVSYDRLDEEEQDIFLYIACLFNGKSVKFFNNFVEDDIGGLKRLAEKSLIRITPRFGEMVVEMHNLLEKLGREIVRAESKGNPGKCRFLTDVQEIEDVFKHQTGTEAVLGIFFDTSLESCISESYVSIDEKSFQGMFNLQFLKIHNRYGQQGEAYRLRLPNGLAYLPRKLKWLEWDHCPLKCLPSNFKAEFLVELRMENSKLEKLWEGTQQLGSLKTIIMSGSKYLKEIPDFSKAIYLEIVNFSWCSELESFPSPLNSESLEYLNLKGCNNLKNFPQVKMESLPHGVEIEIEDCIWNKNLPGLDYLDCLRRCFPLKFLPVHLVSFSVKGNPLEKIWEGVQLLVSLKYMSLSRSENLQEIPDLSKATNLECLFLSNCKSLVSLSSTIRNLQKLKTLEMKECTRLEVLPVDVNLSSLKTLNLIGCSSLTIFPRISRHIEKLYLDNTAIEEVPYCIEMFRRLTKLSMRGCSKLKNISPNIFRLTNLKQVDFTDCGGVITALSVATIKDPYETIEKRNKVEKRRGEKYDEDEDDDEYDYEDEDEDEYFKFQNCLKLDRDARELIIQSSFKSTVVLPGGEVPTYFKPRAYGNYLHVTLPLSSFSDQFLRFNVCLLVESLPGDDESLHLRFHFNGVFYKHKVHGAKPLKDHLVLFSFKFQPTGLTSILDSNDVEFEIEGSMRIKELGIRLLNMSRSLDDRDGRSSETDYNQQPREECDVVETKNSKKLTQMTSSEENFNLPCGQIVIDTVLTSRITEQQDAQLPILRLASLTSSESLTSLAISASSTSTASSERASIFSCWGTLLEKIKGIC